MNKLTLNRCIGVALTLAMTLSGLPAAALGAEADGLCTHHPAHTNDCGYAETGECTHTCTEENGCITALCTHTHVATCFDDQGDSLCRHICSQDTGCGQPVTDCLHTQHGSCGYEEGADCDFSVNGCDQCREESENPLTQIKGTDVVIEGYTFPYTGQEIRPQVTVTVGEIRLTEGTHYTLTYKDNLAAGEASVTVTGVEDAGYEGIVTIPFTIEAPGFTLTEIKGTDVTIDGTEFTYTGDPIEPAITVTVNGSVLTVDRDYTLTYENNIQPGTGTVTVKGIATASMTQGYTGEVSIDFTILEKATEPTLPEDSDKPEDSDDETKPVEYKITKGDRSTWFQNSGKSLSFTTNDNGKNFTGISVNGKGLGKSYYSIKDGVVTLNTSFLNKLTVGKYTVSIHFSDGDAEGTFFVSDQLDTSNPVTGDASNVGFYAAAALSFLAALGAAAYVMHKKVRK